MFISYIGRSLRNMSRHRLGERESVRARVETAQGELVGWPVLQRTEERVADVEHCQRRGRAQEDKPRRGDAGLGAREVQHTQVACGDPVDVEEPRGSGQSYHIGRRGGRTGGQIAQAYSDSRGSAGASRIQLEL